MVVKKWGFVYQLAEFFCLMHCVHLVNINVKWCCCMENDDSVLAAFSESVSFVGLSECCEVCSMFILDVRKFFLVGALAYWLEGHVAYACIKGQR